MVVSGAIRRLKMKDHGSKHGCGHGEVHGGIEGVHVVLGT